MPVTSHNILNQSQNGSDVDIYIQFVFDNADTFERFQRLPSSTNINTWAAGKYADIEIVKDEQEQENAIARVENGENSLTVTQSPVHSTDKKIARKLIKWAVAEDNPKYLDKIASLIDYLVANFTGQQIKNFLQVTDAEWTNIKTRYNKWRNPVTNTSPSEVMADDAVVEID